ncbi:MAG: cobalamin biosynthesis protein [Candidatus Thermoplasmatota archaeon]|nr:cobalamin biosynthesis protein [Candidatus Thermoplasmatota archaeon]
MNQNPAIVPFIIFFISILLDQLFGEPGNRHHPVAFIGKAIEKTDPIFRRFKNEKFCGSLMVLSVTAAFVVLILFIQIISTFSIFLYMAVSAVILKFSFSLRSMKDHVIPAIESIEKGNVSEARKKISMVVRRDTSILNPDLLCSALIETIGEGFVDGVAGPIFYYPFLGVAGAFIQRIINTFDSMIGYKDRRNLRFGWFAAKSDTVLNFVPARMGAFFIWLAGRIKGHKTHLSLIFPEASKTESRNGGWPMGAMAVSLGVKLEKNGHYVLGNASRQPEAKDVREALSIYMMAFWLYTIIYIIPMTLLVLWLVNSIFPLFL